MGNILTKAEVHKVSLKQKGTSTLGGREVWFDWDVLRINYDGRGEYLGEFQSKDQILVVLKNGEFYVTSFDLSNHFETNILCIQKFNANKVWTCAFYDGDQDYYYIKRFQMDASNKKQSFIGESEKSRTIILTTQYYARFEVIFGGNDSFREALDIDADEFIGVKSFKARGKRISTYQIAELKELEPLRFPDPEEEEADDDFENEADLSEENEEPISDSDLIAEITGQMKLFDN